MRKEGRESKDVQRRLGEEAEALIIARNFKSGRGKTEETVEIVVNKCVYRSQTRYKYNKQIGVKKTVEVADGYCKIY